VPLTVGVPVARFIRKGKAKVDALPTIAATTLNPTAPEIAAGLSLTGRIADMAGWTLESTKVDTPDLASRFVPNIPGEQSVGDCTLTFYADDSGTADPVKTALAVDTITNIYIRHSGVGTGKPADCFPVRVSSVGNEYSVGNDPARFVISFAVTALPAQDLPQA